MFETTNKDFETCLFPLVANEDPVTACTSTSSCGPVSTTALFTFTSELDFELDCGPTAPAVDTGGDETVVAVD